MLKLYDSKNNKNKILDIVASTENSTAKQIYFKIKKKYGINISYQGIHKQINELVEEGVLNKDGREYSLSIDWLNKIQYQISNLKRRVVSLDEKNLKPLKKLKFPESNIKVISLDLRTIFDQVYDELLWNKKIPQVYARKNNISFEEAYEKVINLYREDWDSAEGKWRDPYYWIKKLELDISFEELTKEIDEYIKPYPDAVFTIKHLSKKYVLIIASNAHTTFINHKLEKAGLRKYFSATYSFPGDFNALFADDKIYRKICDNLEVSPNKVIHLGSDFEEDYQIPSSIGIKSFMIDRGGKKKESYSIRDLIEFRRKIKEFELKRK